MAGLEKHHKLNFAIDTLKGCLEQTETLRKEADPMERVSLALIIESYTDAIKILEAHRDLDRRKQKEKLEEEQKNG